MRWLTLLLLSLLTASCGPSDEAQLHESAEQAASWAATMRIVCREREERHLPQHFVEVTFDTALQELEQLNKNVAKLKAPDQPRVAALTGQLEAVVARAKSGARQNERTAAGDSRKLEEIERALRSKQAAP